MSEDVKVSVICTTYNHEKFIRDALDGFVSQKTNFKFEVLIHDDASTDATADIIREYEAKYPDLIRPVYQTVNQYSQGVSVTREYLWPMARGEYVAFCEGDDYWCDPYKLQKQYDYLESHPECNICTSRAIIADHETGQCHIQPRHAMSRLYTTEEIITNRSMFFMTATIFMRWDSYVSMPPVFLNKYYADFQRFIYGSMGGGCFCMQDVTTVYNYRHSSSYTEREGKEKLLQYQANLAGLRMFEQINEYYDYKYNDAIQQMITYFTYHIKKREGRLDELQGEEYAEYRLKDMARKKLKDIRNDG